MFHRLFFEWSSLDCPTRCLPACQNAADKGQTRSTGSGRGFMQPVDADEALTTTDNCVIVKPYPRR